MSASLSPQQIVGSYVIERELGRGGMGAIYLGVHRSLGKRAAIKVLLPELSRREDLIARFWAEARAVTAIKHASIVDVYDYGATDDGRTFIVMEYLEGETLGARLKARGLLPIPQAVAIGRQIANALAAAHAVGVVHRDLKPDNVFLVDDPEVVGGRRAKLLDFGVAKLVVTEDGTAKTITGALLGTPHYMSPEQCEGARAVDHRSDLYSLGCTLFQMVSGRLPFESPGVGGLIGMHLHVPPPKLRDRAPHASGELERIVARLLEKHPDARFSSAAEVAAALSTPEATEVDAAASAPLPRQVVDADLATAVSRIEEPSVPPRIPARITTDPPLSPLAPTEVAPNTQRVSTDSQATIARPPKRRTRWAWLGASVGLLGTLAIVVAVAQQDAARAPRADDTHSGKLAVAHDAASADAEPLRPIEANFGGSDAERAEPDELDALVGAIEKQDWLLAGALAQKARKNGQPALVIERLVSPHARQAAKEMERRMMELAAADKCLTARAEAMQFQLGWGSKVAGGTMRLAATCDERSEDDREHGDLVVEAFGEDRFRDAVALCKQRSTMTSDLRVVCVKSACAIKQVELARKWTKSLSLTDQTKVLNECLALGVRLLEAP